MISYILVGLFFTFWLLEQYKGKLTLLHGEERWVINIALYLTNAVFIWLLKFSWVVVVINYSGNYFYSLDLGQKHYIAIFIFQFFLIDFYHYGMHRFYHRYTVLWKVHLVHHSDIEVDSTTHFRHHPIELLFSHLTFVCFAFISQVLIEVIALYSVIAILMSLWQHSNLTYNDNVDKMLARYVMTPNAHKQHHFIDRNFTDSNYGTVFSCWDRWFKTYKPPIEITDSDKFGLSYFRNEPNQTLLETILQPFRYTK